MSRSAANTPRIVRSASARQDLSDIYQHLAREAGPDVADSVLARISTAIDRAAGRPLAYARRIEYVGAPRRINVFRYAIFFDRLREEDGIYIWRIVHDGRDLTREIERP